MMFNSSHLVAIYLLLLSLDINVVSYLSFKTSATRIFVRTHQNLLFSSTVIHKKSSLCDYHQNETPSFDIICNALSEYKNIYNSTTIPFNFNTSSSSPILLGSILHSIRLGSIQLSSSQKNQIKSLGYSINKSEYSFELFLQAWKHFVILKGTQIPVVPRTFVIPSTSEWPEEVWNMNLGQKVQCIRTGQIYNTDIHVQRLNEVNFIRSPSNRSADQLERSLKAYLNVNGHLEIPKGFIVPYGDPIYDQGAITYSLIYYSVYYFIYIYHCTITHFSID